MDITTEEGEVNQSPYLKAFLKWIIYIYILIVCIIASMTIWIERDYKDVVALLMTILFMVVVLICLNKEWKKALKILSYIKVMLILFDATILAMVIYLLIFDIKNAEKIKLSRCYVLIGILLFDLGYSIIFHFLLNRFIKTLPEPNALTMHDSQGFEV